MTSARHCPLIRPSLGTACALFLLFVGGSAAASESRGSLSTSFSSCGALGANCCRNRVTQILSCKEGICDESTGSQGTCVACGEEDGPCCPAPSGPVKDACPSAKPGDPELVCLRGYREVDRSVRRCRRCGEEGSTCCLDSWGKQTRCSNGMRCMDQGDEEARICVSCGNDGEPCCASPSNVDVEACPGFAPGDVNGAGFGDTEESLVTALTAATPGHYLTCTGDAAAMPTVRSGEMCIKCGEIGLLCCRDASGVQNVCQAGSRCFGDSDSQRTCVACGSEGEVCCHSPKDRDSEACPGNSGTDQPLTCTPSQPPLPSESLPGGGLCMRCGRAGQHCCRSAADGAQGRCASGLGCDHTNVCAPCGGLGEPCCPGQSVLEWCPHSGPSVCVSRNLTALDMVRKKRMYPTPLGSWGVLAAGSGGKRSIGATCMPCGQLGQRCCSGDASRLIYNGDADSMQCFGANAMCSQGFCIASPLRLPEVATAKSVENCTAPADLSAAQVSGEHTRSCFAAAAAAKCQESLLWKPDGLVVVPDVCLFRDGLSLSVGCPAQAGADPAAVADTTTVGPAKEQELTCRVIAKEMDCRHQGPECAKGNMKCADTGRAEEQVYLWQMAWGTLQLGYVGDLSYPAFAAGFTCQGEPVVLTRPGRGASKVKQARAGLPLVTETMEGIVEHRSLIEFGTVILWQIHAQSRQQTDGARAFVQDDLIHCASNEGQSQQGKRVVYYVQCDSGELRAL